MKKAASESVDEAVPSCTAEDMKVWQNAFGIIEVLSNGQPQLSGCILFTSGIFHCV